MVPFSFENLRSYVVWSPANRSFTLLSKLKFSCQSEISQLNIEVFVKEHIPEFKIPMDDWLSVQVLQTLYYAVDEGLNLRSRKVLSGLNDLIQRLILAQLKEYVHVTLVLEIVLELDNILMVQCLVKSDLIEQLG